MTSLNVYRHFNLSIQEIFLQGDMVALPSAAVVQEAKKEKAEEASFFKPFAFAALFFASLAGVAIYIFDPFEKPAAVVVEPPPPAPPAEEPELYVRIQVIEFADEHTSPVVNIPLESAEPLISSRTPEPVRPTETAPQKPAATKPRTAPQRPPVPNTSPLPVQGPFYALSIDRASAADAAGLSDAAQGFADVKVTRSASAWRVYVPAQNSAILIDDVPVASAGVYATKKEAVEVAQGLDTGSYVIEEGDTFNVTVCCADLETAKYIAATSGVTDKVIKVIRQ